MSAKDQKKENWYTFLAAFLTFLFYMIRICRRIDLNISLDEIGTFASASALAGNDWSGILRYTRYYGYGFYWIFAGIFYLTDNPYVIYITIYVIDCIVLSCTASLIYKIGIYECRLPNNIISLFFAMLPGLSYSIVNYAYLSNDVMVYTVYWMIIYLIFRLFGKIDDKKRVKYSICLAFAISYILTIHERTIVIFLGVLVLLVFWKIVMKRSIVNTRVFVIFVSSFYLFARITKKIVIGLFWSDIEAETLANTSAIYNDLFWFHNLQEFKVIIDIVVSNVLKTGLATYGVFFLAIVLSVKLAVEIITKKEKIKEYAQQDVFVEKIAFIFILSMAAILITMTGVAVQWGNGVWQKLELELEMGNSLRAFAYLRYYITYIGPIFLIIYSCCIKKIFEKQFYWYAFFVIALLGYYYLTEVDVYVREQKQIMEMMEAFSNQIFNRHLSMAILLFLILLLAGFYRKSFQILFVSVCSCLLFFTYLPSNLELPRLESSKCDATYQYIKTFDDRNDREWIKKDLYVLDNSGCYQFFLNRCALKMWNNEQQGMIFAHTSIDEICKNEVLYNKFDIELLKTAECVALDENEYVYLLRNKDKSKH